MNAAINSSSVHRLFILLFGIMGATYICVQSLLSNTSVLGQLYLYVAIAAFLTGLLSPKAALFALIVSTGYIEYFKRLMSIGGIPSNFDVACSLATAPLLCAGAVINLILSVVMRKRKMSREIVITFALSSLMLAFSIYIAGKENLARSLGGIANTAAYPYLLVLVPAFLTDINDKIKLFRWAYVVFVGVALYMFYHNYFGLTGFEIDYLNTGLSLEARILFESEDVRRCPSTLSSASIVSIMCSLMVLWSFVNLSQTSAVNKMLKYVCCVIFVFASYFTLSRTGWFCGIAALVSYITFQNYKVAVLTYILGISLVISLVVFSPLMLETNTMAKLDRQIKDTFNIVDAKADKVATLGTFNGRLLGYKNLMTKPMMWTPFGWAAAGQDIKKHEALDLGDDTIVWSIIKYGYVTCFVLGTTLLLFLLSVHKFVCSLPKGVPERKLGNLCLATILGIIVGGLGNGAQFQVFPVNVYLFLCLAFVFSMYIKRKEILSLYQVYTR